MLRERRKKVCFTKNDFNRKSPLKTFKRKDSKQAKSISLIDEYFKKNDKLTRDKFDDFLTFIELKSIWSKELEQNILWNSMIGKSNKTSIDYETALRGIMELFKDDDDTKQNYSSYNNTMEHSNETVDKFLKSFNGNQEILYDFEFINYIFFDNDKDKNRNKDVMNLNNNNVDKIIKDIKSKYKFITLSEKEIKNYFDSFHFNNNKNIINHINTTIESLLDKNKKSNNSKNISISSSSNDTNDYKNINNSNLNYNELFDKLLALDKIIFDCMDSLILFYGNKNLIDLTQKFIQNYLLSTKNNIYNNLKLIFENDNKMKITDITDINDENIIISKTKENNSSEKPKSKYLNKREMIYIKKDINTEKNNNNKTNINYRRKIVSNNLDLNNNNNNSNSINDNDSNNNIDNIYENIKDNESDNNLNINNINYKKYKKPEQKLRKSISHEKGKNSRIKTESNNKIISLNIKKLKKNISVTNLNQIKEIDIFGLNNKKEHLSRNNNYYYTEKKSAKTLKDNENDILVEEDLNVFSFGNNMESLENLDEDIENENENENENDNENDNDNEEIINKGTPKLNPLVALDNDDDDDEYDECFKNDNNENLNINKEKVNLSKCRNPNDFTFGKDDHVNNNLQMKISADIDNIGNCMNNYTLSSNKKKFVKNGYYDFKYLYKNNNVKKLFSHNNEHINLMKFYSDEVYIISCTAIKKQKVFLIISDSFFYFLKPSIHMTCISKYSNKSLSSIYISSRNFNLILFCFDKSQDIIIETYRRYDLLRFIKEKINKQVNINISHNFLSNRRHAETESIIKKLSFTPNFESAQKLGILYKYQENFFSAKFHERLVVLCCLGLMYFEENEKSPKVIIPIIGTSIKSMVILQGNDKLYCFQIKTINEECYIFGSKCKNEIIDWIKEFALFKKKYLLKLKQIEPKLEIHEKNKVHKKIAG